MRGVLGTRHGWEKEHTGMQARSHTLLWRLLAVTVALTLSLGLLPGLVTSRHAAAQDDTITQRQYDRLVEAAMEDDPAYGPEEGDLEIDPERVTFSRSDVEDANFYAEATFQNPYAGSSNQFDYGIQFRSNANDFLRFIVISDGTWGITHGTDDVLVSGTFDQVDDSRRGENKVAVYADGETIHVAINDEYVGSATTDVLDDGSISVGTSFLPDSVVEGETTGFTDFSIWSLGGGGGLGPDDKDTPTPEDEDTPEPTDGETYESPTYGYTLTYDPDVWEVTQDDSEDGVDDFRLTNGTSTVQFLGMESTQSPRRCIRDTIKSLKEDADIESVEVAVDDNGDDMQGTLDDGSEYAVVNVTFDGTDLTAYYQCTPIEEDTSILKINQITNAEDYNDEIEARIDLLDGFSIDGSGVNTDDNGDDNGDDSSTPEDVETPEADSTDSDLPEGSVVVYLEATDPDGPVVLASLIPDGKETEVQLFVLGGEPGARYDAGFAEGTCRRPGDVTIEIGTTDNTGLLDENVSETVEDLSSGDLVMVLVDEAGDVVACGDPSEFVE
jgi:hypothetical protein